MKLTEVLQRLEKFGISVKEEKLEVNGSRTLVLAGRLPSPPFPADQTAVYALNFLPGEDEVELEVREAIRRRMWHRMTDVFGDDDSDDTEDLSTEISNSHLHTILPKHPEN